jgi:hypothetical protein
MVTFAVQLMELLPFLRYVMVHCGSPGKTNVGIASGCEGVVAVAGFPPVADVDAPPEQPIKANVPPTVMAAILTLIFGVMGDEHIA